MPETPENSETSPTIYDDETVSEIWMEVTDLVDDPSVAKKVIETIVLHLEGLPHSKWKALLESAQAE